MLRITNASESRLQNEECHTKISTDDGDYFNEGGRMGLAGRG